MLLMRSIGVFTLKAPANPTWAQSPVEKPAPSERGSQRPSQYLCASVQCFPHPAHLHLGIPASLLGSIHDGDHQRFVLTGPVGATGHLDNACDIGQSQIGCVRVPPETGVQIPTTSSTSAQMYKLGHRLHFFVDRSISQLTVSLNDLSLLQLMISQTDFRGSPESRDG
jgi:hypothetical protein